MVEADESLDDEARAELVDPMFERGVTLVERLIANDEAEAILQVNQDRDLNRLRGHEPVKKLLEKWPDPTDESGTEAE